MSFLSFKAELTWEKKMHGKLNYLKQKGRNTFKIVCKNISRLQVEEAQQQAREIICFIWVIVNILEASSSLIWVSAAFIKVRVQTDRLPIVYKRCQ